MMVTSRSIFTGTIAMNTLRKMLAWQVVATHISVSPSNISNFRIKL
jgi:hypothetical protein